jgi:cephalosporin hydroxylase
MHNLLQYAISRLRGLVPSSRRGLFQSLSSKLLLLQNGIDLNQRDTRGSLGAIYRRRFRLTVRQWLLYHHHSIIFNQPSWMGVPIFKSPLDIWIYQEIIHQVQPDIIIEIGSAVGGSTLYLAHLLDLLGKGTVVSIDIDRSTFQAKHPRIIPITGNSSSPEVVAQVAALAKGKRGLVIHDGDHHKEQVLADLRLYADFVSIGSYLIVEDGIVDLFKPEEMTWVQAKGPLAAVEEFTKEASNFVIDLERERYLITYNPRGYLRRIR